MTVQPRTPDGEQPGTRAATAGATVEPATGGRADRGLGGPTAGGGAEAATTDELGSMASLLRAVADAPGARARGALTAGQLVAGKYRVVRAIGQGGMGVVYLARDERLERDVALKLGRALSAGALARVEREARALARLSHPNGVVVHDRLNVYRTTASDSPPEAPGPHPLSLQGRDPVVLFRNLWIVERSPTSGAVNGR